MSLILFNDGKKASTEDSTVCGIYRWEFPSGKNYIGQSINVINRVSEELRSFRSNNSSGLPKLFNAYKKYGDKGLKILLEEKCSSDIIGDREEYYINFYNSYKNGYNSTRGNEKKYGPLTEEGKLKIKSSLKKYWTDEKRQDWSDKMKNWHKNLEEIEANRQKQSGKDFYSVEANREFHRERTTKMRTSDVAKRQGESLKKTIQIRGHWKSKKIQLKFNNEIKEFPSESECLKNCKIGRKHLLKILNGELDHWRGWCLPDTILSEKSDGIYKLVDPLGIVHTFYNMSEFAKENGLNKGSVVRLVNKMPNCHSVSGWKRIK